jgi:recombination protein RecA
MQRRRRTRPAQDQSPAEKAAVAIRPRRSLPEQIQEHSEKEIIKEVEPPCSISELLPSGSTMLNLACSDSIHGAFRKGKMVNVIGDSSSGKSLLCLQALVEGSFSKHFKDFTFYYDDVEGGCDFDIASMFGERAAEAAGDRIQFESSASVEELQDRLLRLSDEEEKFVYVLDSYDVLDSIQAKLKAAEEAKAREKGKEVNGSYGMDKVKRVRAMFRKTLAAQKKTGSIFIVISQTKAVIDPRSFKKKTRSAEDALEFHSYHCVWFAKAGDEKFRDRIIGTKTKIKLGKNRLTGKKRLAEFSIFNELGIDDTSSCIDFLIAEKHWKKKKNTIVAHEFDIEATQKKLIRHIETEGLERNLRRIVGRVWVEVEESLKFNRKSRY